MSEVQNPASFNAPAVKQLYDAVDFIGMSAYPEYNQVDLSGMETATYGLDRELKVRRSRAGMYWTDGQTGKNMYTGIRWRSAVSCIDSLQLAAGIVNSHQ